jgi:hypothetical protein
VAAYLARCLVRVVVERLAAVADLKGAAAALDGSEQRRLDALTGQRLAVREDGRPSLRTVAVADAPALLLLLEDVDGLTIGAKSILPNSDLAARTAVPSRSRASSVSSALAARSSSSATAAPASRSTVRALLGCVPAPPFSPAPPQAASPSSSPAISSIASVLMRRSSWPRLTGRLPSERHAASAQGMTRRGSRRGRAVACGRARDHCG